MKCIGNVFLHEFESVWVLSQIHRHTNPYSYVATEGESFNRITPERSPNPKMSMPSFLELVHFSETLFSKVTIRSLV